MPDEDPLPPPPPQMAMMAGNYATSTLVKSQESPYGLSIAGDGHPIDLAYGHIDWIPKVYIEKGKFLLKTVAFNYSLRSL